MFLIQPNKRERERERERENSNLKSNLNQASFRNKKGLDPKNSHLVSTNLISNSFNPQENTPKIGIIVPIFNVKLYLKECLDSICKQTYANLSIVLVNDASTDESLEIVKEYALKDERILIIDKENGGLSSARNVGIELFGGEYELEFDKEFSQESDFYAFKIINENALNIKHVLKAKAFFKDESKGENKGQITDNIALEIPKIDYLTMPDSDDYLSADYVEWNLKLLLETKADVAFNSPVIFNNFDRSFLPDLLTQNINSKTLTSNEWLRQLQKDRKDNFWAANNTFIKFSYLCKIKLKFINFIAHEDHHFGILLAFEAKIILFINTPLYYHRFRSGSIMDRDKKNTLNSLYIPSVLKNYVGEFANDQVLIRFYRNTGYYYSSLVLKDFISHYKDQEKAALFNAVFKGIKSGWGNENYAHFDANHYEIITRLSLNLIFNFYKNKSYSFEHLDDLNEQIIESLTQLILKNIGLKDRQIQNLNNEISSLNTQIAVLNNESLKLKTENQRLKNELASLPRKISEQELANLKLDESVKKLEVKKLEKELGLKLSKLEPRVSLILNENLRVSAVARVRNHLAYRLGAAIIVCNKSLWGLAGLPFVLNFIKAQYKKEQVAYQALIKQKPEFKLPKIETYPDYKAALKEKECFTYKLGEAMIRADKTWYKGGLMKFYVEAKRLEREFKKSKVN